MSSEKTREKGFNHMKRAFISLLLLPLLLTGCTGQQMAQQESPSDDSATGILFAPSYDLATGTIFAMDTVMDFTIYGEESLLTAVENRVNELESELSVTDANSEIYAVNHNGSGKLSEDSADLLSKALNLCALTGGALDLSIYPVVRAWGFTTGDYGIPDEAELEELLSHVDYRNVSFDAETSTVALEPDMEIDFGSVAKGYTGDQIMELLRENGVTSALLNLGGNVQALGTKPDGSLWKVAVQDPSGDGYLGVLEIDNQAVITSGGYERYFVEDGVTYWHIIDPATGTPARNGLISVTIVGDSGLLCDGLSTALFVMGLDDAVAFWQENGGFEAVFVTEDGQLIVTEGLQNKFSLPDDSGAYVMRIQSR
jgi:thiamine biosynthesis lipoprotein